MTQKLQIELNDVDNLPEAYESHLVPNLKSHLEQNRSVTDLTENGLDKKNVSIAPLATPNSPLENQTQKSAFENMFDDVVNILQGKTSKVI